MVKKIKCPYKDAQDRCTHKFPLNKNNNKSLPNCPFKAKEKCQMYNSLINKQKSFTELPVACESFIKREMRKLKERFN